MTTSKDLKQALARNAARQEEEALFKRYRDEGTFDWVGKAITEAVGDFGVDRVSVTLGDCGGSERDEATAVAMQLGFSERGYLTFLTEGVPKERYAVSAGARAAVVISLVSNAPETKVAFTRDDALKASLTAYDSVGSPVPVGVDAVFSLRVLYEGDNASALVGATSLYLGLFQEG